MRKIVSISAAAYGRLNEQLRELAVEEVGHGRDQLRTSDLEISFESDGKEFFIEFKGVFHIYTDIEDFPEGTFTVLKYLVPICYDAEVYDSDGELVDVNFDINNLDIVKA